MYKGLSTLLGSLGPSDKYLVSHTHWARKVKAKVDAEERLIDSFGTAISVGAREKYTQITDMLNRTQ